MTHVFCLVFFRALYPRVRVNSVLTMLSQEETWVIHWTSHSFRKSVAEKRKFKSAVIAIVRVIEVCSSLAALDSLLPEILDNT